MEKKLDIAYISYHNTRGKTEISISTKPNSSYYSGEKVENLTVKTEGDLIEVSFEKGKYGHNRNSGGCWHYSTPYYASSSISCLEVKPEFTEECEILPAKERLFSKDLPAEIGLRTKDGYVEYKNPKITKVVFSATNYSLTFEENT